MKIDYTNLDFIDDKLKELLRWVEARYGFGFVLTSLYREGTGSVHNTLPVRGHDLRCWDEDVGNLIAFQINEAWSYDHTRPSKVCAMYHDTGSGSHLHLQSHSNTRLK